jgi:hypothetical protein
VARATSLSVSSRCSASKARMTARPRSRDCTWSELRGAVRASSDVPFL